MKTFFMMIVSAAASLAAAATNAQAGGGASGFSGHWRVTGVAISDQGIQALADNDPSLMGKGLSVSAARLAWDRPTATHDVCASPQFTRLRTPAPADLRPQLRKLGMPRPTAFAIHCASGSWGPGYAAMIFRGAGEALAMPWYDGGLLKLGRQ